MPTQIDLARFLSNKLCIHEIDGWDRWNSFTTTILRFEAPTDESELVGFSRENVAAFTATRPGDYYYPIGQVFEPDVIREVCDLQGVDIYEARMLRSHDSERISQLRDRINRVDQLGDAELIVLISALVTLSRFELAHDVLDRAGARGSRFNFEAALLRYIIGNRTEGRQLNTDVLTTVRRVAESSEVPAHRVLDACSIAVVWYLKGVGVSKKDFEWFARTGNNLITESHDAIPAVTLSAWYRAVAMIPAQLGNVLRTRTLMDRAAENAQIAIANSEGPFAKNLYKTYLESSVKEHMYISREEDAALDAAQTLVSWDPHWSVSMGEYADVLAAFDHPEEAAQVYDRATSLGVPYVTYHLRKAAQQYEKAGMAEQSIARYLVLGAMLPDPVDALSSADALLSGIEANDTLHDARQQFTAS